MDYVIPQRIESDRLIRRTFIDRLEDISLIPAENESSIKLALAIGCNFEKNINFRGNTCCIYRHV